MLVTKKHLLTGVMNTMDLPVTQEQMDLYNSPKRPNVQDIFPDLDVDQREFLISGMLPGDYDNMQFLIEENENFVKGGHHD